MGSQLCKPESINFAGRFRCQSACCGGSVHNDATDGSGKGSTFKKYILRFKKSVGIHKQNEPVQSSEKETS